MALLLALETATRNCSVALSNNGTVLAFQEEAAQGYTHAEQLHVFIQEVLATAGIGFSDLDAIAVSKGPGSYTGLRIGVSAAKGLCYALQKPLIAIDTLTVLAHAVPQTDGTIIPMIDARRMEVYAAIFSGDKKIIRPVQAEILTSESYATVPGTIYVVGDSSDKAKTVLQDERFQFLDTVQFPSAQVLSCLAFQKWQLQEFEDVAYFEPFYLKDFMLSR